MSDPLPTLLIIEDEIPIRRFLRAGLPSHGYHLEEAGTGEEGLLKAVLARPAVILLDLGLPDMDGLEVIKRLREWASTPIIILSAREREADKIAALDAGADDYLTKPFGMGELLARLRVAFRRIQHTAETTNAPVFRVGNLEVDLRRRRVAVNNSEVHLTPIEYKLLAILIQHAGKVVLHHQLLSAVWGSQHQQENQYLRVYMGMLRHKIEPNPGRPRYLLTEPGVGYRLAVE